MKNLLATIHKTEDIKNYRIFLRKSQSSTLGVYGKIIGGAYSPITNQGSISGVLQVEWKDGKVSFVNVNSALLSNPKLLLNNAKSISINDKYSKKFLASYKLTKPSKQFSKDTAEIISDKQDQLVKEINVLYEIEEKLGIKKHEAEISVSNSEVELVNSRGLKLTDKFSSYSISSGWDMKVGFELSKRVPFSISHYKKDIEFLQKVYTATRKPYKINKFVSKNPILMVYPEATWSLMNHFLVTNILGSKVANKMSRYKKSDFVNSRKVFGDDITVNVNPRQDLTPDASNFSSEGVENSETTFIDNGKLITPVLDLKHSQKLKMKPTSFIESPFTSSFFNHKIKPQNLGTYIRNTKEGVLVPYFLGMHTQNTMTGDYSLPVPYGIYIRDGRLLGTFKAMIIGNIFDDLKKSFKLVEHNLFPQPGICFKPKIFIE